MYGAEEKSLSLFKSGSIVIIVVDVTLQFKLSMAIDQLNAYGDLENSLNDILCGIEFVFRSKWGGWIDRMWASLIILNKFNSFSTISIIIMSTSWTLILFHLYSTRCIISNFTFFLTIQKAEKKIGIWSSTLNWSCCCCIVVVVRSTSNYEITITITLRQIFLSIASALASFHHHRHCIWIWIKKKKENFWPFFSDALCIKLESKFSFK